MRPLSALLLLSVIAGLAPSWCGGQPLERFNRNDPNARNIQSIIIKWKRTTHTPQAQAPTVEELQRLKQAAGIDLTTYTDHGWGIVFPLPRFMSRIESEEIAARIRALPEIESAVANVPVYLDAVPNDPLFQPQQWNLQSGPGGIQAQPAWDLLGAGDVATAVAVVDEQMAKAVQPARVPESDKRTSATVAASMPLSRRRSREQESRLGKAPSHVRSRVQGLVPSGTMRFPGAADTG